MKSVLDPSFHYVPSIKTDIRKTFARIRKEAREQSVVVPQARGGVSTVAVLFPDQKAASNR